VPPVPPEDGGTDTPAPVVRDGTSKEKAILLTGRLTGSFTSTQEEMWYVYTQPERGQAMVGISQGNVYVSIYAEDDQLGGFSSTDATSYFNVTQIYHGMEIYIKISPNAIGSFTIYRS
jgi:hypothetical protein